MSTINHQHVTSNYLSMGQQHAHDSQLVLNTFGQNQIYDSRGSNGNIAKDIDMLDSEFAQEESRQIEAYYRSVNKESSEHLKSSP